MEIYCKDSAATEALGRLLGTLAQDGDVYCLTGTLGAGKTLLSRGMAAGLGADINEVNSPTFAIMNVYSGRLEMRHFDLYRIHTEVDLSAAGFYDYLDMGAVVAAEWSENCADLLALENPIYINIDRLDETTRKITITRPGA